MMEKHYAPLSRATQDEVKVAATEGPCCRVCGYRDGEVVEMNLLGTHVLIGIDATPKLAGTYLAYRCSRCHHRVLVEAPD